MEKQMVIIDFKFDEWNDKRTCSNPKYFCYLSNENCMFHSVLSLLRKVFGKQKENYIFCI